MTVLRLELIIGCMFAGKSTEMIRRANRLRSIHKKILVINHTNDTRTCESVKTHDDTKMNAIKISRLRDIIRDPIINNADVICIDEGQFFDDIGDFVRSLEHTSKIIIISALDGDRHRNPFRNITDLIPLADSVDKLHALECLPSGDIVEANFSMLIGQDTGETVLIGASETYRAVSRHTYLMRYQLSYTENDMSDVGSVNSAMSNESIVIARA